MLIASKLTIGTVAVADIAANGPLGTAANTVDVASAFNLTQTTAGVTITLPNPTISEIGQQVTITNTGTADTTVNGNALKVGRYMTSVWNGSVWVNGDVPSNVFIQGTALTAGANVITHNLSLLTPFRNISVDIRNVATGQTVDFSITTFATNSITINVAVAIASADIFITQL